MVAWGSGLRAFGESEGMRSTLLAVRVTRGCSTLTVAGDEVERLAGVKIA